MRFKVIPALTVESIHRQHQDTGNISRINLSNLVLDGMDFSGTLIEGSRIELTSFLRTNFDEATFKKVSFSKVAAISASFKGAIFEDVTFYGGMFQLGNFKGAKFVRCVFDASASFMKTNQNESQFDNCIFRNVSFNGSDFGKSSFENTQVFPNAFFYFCDFTKSFTKGFQLVRPEVRAGMVSASHFEDNFRDCKGLTLPSVFLNARNFIEAAFVDRNNVDFSGKISEVFATCKVHLGISQTRIIEASGLPERTVYDQMTRGMKIDEFHKLLRAALEVIAEVEGAETIEQFRKRLVDESADSVPAGQSE